MKIFKKYSIPLLLFLIVSFGFFLRVYKLTSVPFGFFCDEAAVGYNAYTILTQGKDEYGTSFPLFFQSFNDYKTPIEIYSTVPSITIFGLTEFAVRIVSVMYAVLSLIMLYFLTTELFFAQKEKKIIALFATLFLAISPWYVHLSRIGWESVTPFVLCVITGTYFFLKSKRKPSCFVLSTLFFSIGMYTYFPARVFIPLFFLGLLILFPVCIPKKKLLLAISITIMAIFALPFLSSIQNGTFAARLNQVSIFSAPPTYESITEHIAVNYFRHFSVDFLFTKGDIGMPGQVITRHSVRGIGELYFIQLPLIVLGLFYLLKKQRKIFILVVLWLLLYPTGSMFTLNESPYATRSIIGVLPFSLLSGIGTWYVFVLCKKIHRYLYYVSILTLAGAVFFSFIVFFQLYFYQYPLYSSDVWGWQFGAKPVLSYFVQHEKQYKNLYMEGAFNAPEIFLKFYSPHDCFHCHIGDPENDFHASEKQLFALTPSYIQTHILTAFHVQKTIYYPNGQKAFLIGTLDHL